MNEELFDELPKFDFFQAVRLLELSDSDKDPVGFDSDPHSETVRFTSRAAFGFSSGDIHSVEPGASDESPPRLEVNFLGIATPVSFGSLPHVYVELIQQLTREKNHALKAFIDCFNHRLISLFYRAWKKHQFAVAYERNRSDVLEEALFAVVGLGGPAFRNRLGFDDRAVLARMGHLVRGRSTASGLTDSLRDYFEVGVEVEEFVPAWYTIDPQDQYRLGSRRGTRARLGQDVVLGSRMCTGEYQFRVRLGPLAWESYRSFLPQGSNHARLLDFVRLAVGPELDFEVQLVLRASDVPRLRLLPAGEGPSPLRLGWSAWVRAEEHDVRDRREGLFRAKELQPSS